MGLTSIFSIKRIISRISNPLTRLKLYLKGKLGWLGVPLVVPFNAYSNAQRVFICGRVTEDKGIAKPEPSQSVWQNMLAMIKRYSSDTIPEQEVEVVLGEQVKWVKANENGLFYTSFDVTADVPYHYKARFKRTHKESYQWEEAPVLDFSEGFDLGLVSDIDDTILVSHSTKIFRKLRLMLFRNAATRKSIPGMAEFYQAFTTGSGNSRKRPVFYVSSSEWNLYDLLIDFLDFMHFPQGILKLRESEINPMHFWKSGRGNHQLKEEKINIILKQFPSSRFVLVGDSGQRDLEIYHQIAVANPERIVMVYIRRVKGIWKSKKKIRAWKEKYRDSKIHLEIVDSHGEILKSAVASGIIRGKRSSKILEKKH